jgi:predicted RNA-binding Zn ribbon-like protein
MDSVTDPEPSEPGRKPAPGRLRVVQDFVNTVDLESGEEQLGDPAAAAAWLAERGLLAAGTGLDGDDVERLHEVREALRSLARGNNGGAVDDGAVATLARHADAAPLVVRIGEDGSAPLVPAGRGAAAAVAALLAIVHDAEVDGTWRRFKACREHTCEWAFYDHSKNRSSTWCVMSVCGNRAKARSYRRRHADA